MMDVFRSKSRFRQLAFLTLMSTDGGNGIGHDQICFADPWLMDAQHSPASEDRDENDGTSLREKELIRKVALLPAPARVYGILVDASVPAIQDSRAW